MLKQIFLDFAPKVVLFVKKKKKFKMNLLTPRNTVTPLPYHEIYTWGWNNLQLGHHPFDADDTAPVSPMKNKSKQSKDISEPVLLDNSLFSGSKVVIAATGGSHTVIITEDKKIYTFGRNQRYRYKI